MAHVEKITGIPREKLDAIRSSFEKEGATTITVSEEPNGTFSIVASWPDPDRDLRFSSPAAVKRS
jgi:hypothetical protein